MSTPAYTESVFTEVARERARQDEQWGGPAHDDRHIVLDWNRFLIQQIDRGVQHSGNMRRRYVNIAALAIAAIESLDRKAGRS